METVYINALDVNMMAGYTPYIFTDELITRIYSENKWLRDLKGYVIKHYSSYTEVELEKLTQHELQMIYEELGTKNIVSCINEHIKNDTTHTILGLHSLFPIKNSIVRDRKKYMHNIENKIETTEKLLFHINNIPIVIRGKISTSSISDDAIIYIKKRHKRMLGFIPIHEIIQLEIIMWLLQKKKAIHIELFQKEQYIIEYTHNKELWMECITNLYNFLHRELIQHI
jgi:hypothetical protein